MQATLGQSVVCGYNRLRTFVLSPKGHNFVEGLDLDFHTYKVFKHWHKKQILEVYAVTQKYVNVRKITDNSVTDLMKSKSRACEPMVINLHL